MQCLDEPAGARAEGEQERVINRDHAPVRTRWCLGHAGQGHQTIDTADGFEPLRHDENDVGLQGCEGLGSEGNEWV